ncbi:hypothetical protein PPYR_02300 [Photinus pyralis]|uniref:Uncharacterized protein n=1 Tax=Photinus pyralis TaxID=7054 RepID=A0A5N4B7K0_PHOPY|nr:hypothetical protein PPYR_02300 [Photinus pyralis]
METLFKPPEPLQLDGNIAENWRKFSQKFDLFLTATGLSTKAEEKKVAVLLNLIGYEALELYNTFSFVEQEEKTVETVKAKFDEYCSPKKNVIFERFKFNKIVQQECQPFDVFVSELRKAIKTTEYAQQDDMLRDRIVMGIYNKSTQEKLLREASLTVTKAIDICRAIEVSRDQSKVLQSEATVHSISKKSMSNQPVKQVARQVATDCQYCGYQHAKRRCPAYGKTCARCQGRNHFARVCLENPTCKGEKQSSTQKLDKRKIVKKKVHEIAQCSEFVKESDSDSASSEAEFYVSSISTTRKTCSQQESMWTKELSINGKIVRFKLVSKSNVSLIPYGNASFKIKSLVEADNQIPLLGLNDCLELRLIKRIDSLECSNKFKTLDDVVKQYSNVFSGLGKFPTQHHITLKDNVRSRISAIRHIFST